MCEAPRSTLGSYPWPLSMPLQLPRLHNWSNFHLTCRGLSDMVLSRAYGWFSPGMTQWSFIVGNFLGIDGQEAYAQEWMPKRDHMEGVFQALRALVIVCGGHAAGSCDNNTRDWRTNLRRQNIDDVMVLATVCKGFNNEPVRMRGRTWTTRQTARGRYYACRVPKLRGKGISRHVRPGKRSELQISWGCQKKKNLPRCEGSRQFKSLERPAKSSNHSAGWSQWLLVRLALDHQGLYYLIKQCTLDFNECAFIAHRWNNVSRFLAQVQTS